MSFLGIKNPFRTGGGAVTRAATDLNAAQQGRLTNLTTGINNVFADPAREAQTQAFMGALRGNLARTTDKNFGDIARKTKFATARQGLTGGSVDVSRQGENISDLLDARLRDESQVLGAGDTLRQNDQAFRQQALSQALGAAGLGSPSLAGGAVQGNMLPDFVAQSLDSLFAGYKTRQQNAALRAGYGAP
jgi:hypothetical protein